MASRLTGLLRVLAVAGALGTTFLGNTYQSANLVSNLLFELLAAGLLSSVLVPAFVGFLAQGRRSDAETLAGALLGVALVALSLVVVVGLALRPWVMGVLTMAVADAAVRAEEIRLGSFLLVLFLPQVPLYAVGAVATALLQADHRFGAAAFAPVANNLAVIATMGLFWWIEGGDPGLRPGLAGRLVLGLGTTAGVGAMTLLPLMALRRAGLRLRPRWQPRLPELAALGRAGAWGAVQLAGMQLLLAVTLVLANRIEGGVVAYHLAFTAFLLPFAVLAYPVMTTLYPRLASQAAAGRWDAFRHSLGRGVRTTVLRVAPASALLVALAAPGLALIRLGALDGPGARLTARVLAAYGVGLVGYAVCHLLTRASYAAGDVRTPALVTLCVAVAGSLLMVAGNALGSDGDRVVALGLAHSLVMTAGAAVLAWTLRRRIGSGWPAGAAVVRGGIGALIAGGAAWSAARISSTVVSGGGRPAAALALVLGTSAAVGAYAAAQWVLGAPELARPWSDPGPPP